MPTFVHQGPASAVDDSGKDIQLKATPSGALVTGNIPTKFRETFETWPNDNWTQSQSPSGSNNDLVFLDGNALAASYLVISKDPFSQGTDTYVDTTSKFSMPAEVVAGLHLSQTAWGHDASIEFIEADYLNDLPNIAIAGLSQIATAVTVDTVAPHNLVPGQRIGIRDCSDSRFNYPSLVVSSIPTPTQFVCTGGPNGALSGLTAIASVPGAKGSVFRRSALSLSKNGTALHFESPTNTLGFFYSRASAGDVFPFGSGSGNSNIARQATSVGSSGSTALTSAAYTYAWSPTTEYKLTCLADRLQWTDSAVDTTAAGSARLTRTQIIPDPFKEYFIRFKLNAQQSVTVPGANIQSIAKIASATATVTTFTPHGLVSNDLVVGFGVANATAFPALTTPAAVTVISSTQFTVTWGSSTTATSYGGFIARANGTCPLPGAVSQAIQSAIKTTLVDGSHQVVLVGSASWSGVAIGDHVNLYGVRDSSTNNLLGIDGVWKVANIATTTLTLVNANSFSPVVADFNNPACAGGVIKRTEMRLSYFRVFEFERQRFEMLARPSGDVAAAAPVSVQNTAAVSGSVSVAGTVAVDSAIGNPVTVGVRASNANIAAMSATGDSVGWLGTMIGAGIVKPFSLPEADWQTPAQAGGLVNSAVPVIAKEAAGTGIRNHVTSVDIFAEALTNATEFRIREPDLTCSSQTLSGNVLTVSTTHNLAAGDAIVFTAVSGASGISTGVTYYVLTTPAATTLTLSTVRGGATQTITGTGVTATFHKVLWQTRIPTTGRPPGQIVFQTPLRGSVNTNLQIQTATASGAGAVYASLQGYVAP